MFVLRLLAHIPRFLRLTLSLLAIPAYAQQPSSAAPALRLSCVEAVWCDIAQQIGGSTVQTHALIHSEGLDPHHLQPSPLMAQQLAQSDAILLNGATYDDWAKPLHAASSKLFIAADYADWHIGDDPHLFFDLPTVHKTAQRIAEWLSTNRPQARADINQNLARFERDVARLSTQLERLRHVVPNAPFAMTEPAGERLLYAAGLHMINEGWARALMNESGLSPRDTAQLETAIQHKEIRFLVRNPALEAPQAHAVEALAQQAHIPIITIGESLPAGLHWQDWLGHILTTIETTLTQQATP